MDVAVETITADSVAALLNELVALPVEERLPRLRTDGDAETTLIALSEACDRMTATEVAAALTASEMLVALADELGSPRAQAETRGARVLALSYSGEYAEALVIGEAAASLTESTGLVVEAGRAQLSMVHPLARLGRYDDAIAIGEVARAAFESAVEPVLSAKADISLGAVYDMLAEQERALTHYDRALTALAGDSALVAQVESNRGVALMGLDRFTEAEAAFQVAVEAFTSLGLNWAAAIAEGNLAYMASRQGRLERAMHHFERARRCIEEDESPGDLARLLAEQADAIAALGMPAEAIRSYDQALPRLIGHGLALETAQTRAGLGLAQLRLGRIADAEATLADAARLFDRLGQDVARSRLDLTRSELAAKQGRRQEARVLASDALDTLAGRPSDEALARERLARLDLEAGDLTSAAEHVRLALPVAERLDIVPLRARLLHLRGLVARGRGRHQEALSDIRGAIEQVERVRGTLQAERFRTGFLGDHLAIYDDAILAAVDLHPPDVGAAFAMAEQAKSRALLDLVAGALDLVEAAERSAADPAEARLLAELARVRAKLNWHYGDTDDDGREPDVITASDPRRQSVQVLEQELNDLEDRLASVGGVAGLFAPPVTFETALRAVPVGTALIEYYVAGTELLAFVLRDGKGHVSRRLASVGDIDVSLRRLQFQIGRAVAGTARAASPERAARLLSDTQRELRGLFDLLIAPIHAQVEDARQLIVVPHGSLHAIPFNALWDGERYLIERQEVVVAPSASLLAQLGERRPKDWGDALVLGVPDDLAPRIAVEAAEVGAVLAAQPLVGPAATVGGLRDAAPGARIVHLACHGRFVAGNPMASGLKLGDGWLTVRDIYGLRLNSPHVTLSGCDTGRAAVGSGDELLGLVRAFIAAGASSLLLSLWVADDESTTSLMVDFYRALRRNVPLAAALRDAQCALLARQPHPAFWAPFILGGFA